MTNWTKVDLEEARKLSHIVHVLIWWRPAADLPEDQQYALVHNTTTASAGIRVKKHVKTMAASGGVQ